MAYGPSGRGSDPRKRTSGSRPRGTSKASRGTSRGGARPAAGPQRGGSRPRTAEPAPAPARPRFTGRAAVLVLVLALLMVSYASSMRAFLEQRHHLASLRASIASSQAEVDRLSREQKRWKDPAYVRTVAHQRFGWVLPGEIGFQVLDENGRPLGHTDSLSAPNSVTEATRPLWWQSAWGSVVSAGKPAVDPRTVTPPVRRIGPRSGPPAGRSAGRSTGTQP
jgi:cell division protein FtsB